MGRIAHLGTELAIVVLGVLLALWAQAWFESRKEAAIHRETLAQMDDMFGRVLVQTAARVASSECAVRRIAELDDALRASDGQWRGMPLQGLPNAATSGHFPPVYVFDSDVLAMEIFDTARQNGTMAGLSAEDRRFYLAMERQFTWLNDVWDASGEPQMRLSVLGADGPLSDSARDEMRQILAWHDMENRVTILRAHSLARLARERGFQLDEPRRADFRAKIERDRGMFGDCVADIDPLNLEPVSRRPAPGAVPGP